MRTLKHTQTENKTKNVLGIFFKSLFVMAMVFMTSNSYGQDQEVEFDVYTNSAAKASRYLLGDDVAMRDCASTNCEKITTINIGTNVRLLAKSETPQVINGIKSRWYKVKLGPQTGWIWGGLIAQKTMTSAINPEVKFVFGEAGNSNGGKNCFQIRAIKNGEEIDRIMVKSASLDHTVVDVIENNNYSVDVIRTYNDKSYGPVVTTKSYVIFKNDVFQKTNSLTAYESKKQNKDNYASLFMPQTN